MRGERVRERDSERRETVRGERVRERVRGERE